MLSWNDVNYEALLKISIFHSTVCPLFSADNGSMSTISSGPQNQQPFEVLTHFTQTVLL